MRQQFEAWAAHEERLNLTMRESNGHRIYADERTLAAWDAWQAVSGVNDEFRGEVTLQASTVASEGTSAGGGDAGRLSPSLCGAMASAASREGLIALLDEVRQCFTRDDDLPGDLLPRIDTVVDGPAGPIVGSTGADWQSVADVVHGEVVMRVDADRLQHGTVLYAKSSAGVDRSQANSSNFSNGSARAFDGADGTTAGWRPMDASPVGEEFLACIEVTNILTEKKWWEQHVLYRDDEDGCIARDYHKGWDLEDYAGWRPLPAPPGSAGA